MNKKQQEKQISAHIRHHLLQQQKSDQTIKAYCQQEHINVQAFYSWRKRYKNKIHIQDKPKNTSTHPKVSFTSVGKLTTQIQSSILFDIRFPGGPTVSIYPGTTAKEFAPFMTLITGSK